MNNSTLSHHARRVLGLLMLASSAAAAAPAGDNGPFTYTAPGGVVFTVTADGLSKIEVAGRVLATGGWRLFHPGEAFPSVDSNVDLSQVRSQLMAVRGEDSVQVVHEMPDATVTFVYQFRGEDVTITARVDNHNPRAELPCAGFTGLVFQFDREPNGLMRSHSANYIEANRGLVSHCHPCYASPVGGSWAADSSAGVGLTPLDAAYQRSLLLWWSVRSAPNARSLMYLRPQAVPAGGARVYQMGLRVSRKTHWKHLLTPYRDFFRAAYGPKQYVPDHRPFIMFGGGSEYHATPANPYGFNGPMRQIHRPEGMARFCDSVVPPMKLAGVQGMIAWAPYGMNPRGAMYRTDFNVWPPAIWRNLPLLRQRFEEADLRLGIATRPPHMTLRRDANTDLIIGANADDPHHLNVIWGRFRAMIDNGFTLFYLDSFGSDLDDVKIMRFLRQKMGPRIQTFSEHDCDIILVWTGLYDNIRWDAKARDYRSHGLWEVYNWLVPDIGTWITNRVDAKSVPKGAESVYSWAFRHHMTMAVGDYLVGRDQAEIRRLSDEYLTAEGRWKK